MSILFIGKIMIFPLNSIFVFKQEFTIGREVFKDLSDFEPVTFELTFQDFNYMNLSGLKR